MDTNVHITKHQWEDLKTALEFGSKLFATPFKIEILVEGEGTEWEETHISVENEEFSIYESNKMLEQPGLSQTYLRPAWQVMKTVMVPGVHYYKDGSGEPDTYEEVEVGEISDDIVKIASTVYNAYVDAYIDSAVVSWSEARAYHEMHNVEEDSIG